ncbi:MAG: fibro-slime domain-containing protein [Anaerovoracaceae bacterium]|nr:fibro-slime domain-containing protein [Anaerovoracaceae bacterium]
MGLASVVVFCTTYALILPAITMEEAYCGITEHVHTEDCYSQADTVEEKQLVCTIDPADFHEHTADCYDEEGNLICGQEEKPQHVHTDACYEMVEVPSDTKILTCGMEEHTHTKACFADSAVDVETPQIWEQTMADAPLTGEWRNDLLAVAQTQLGYQESQNNYIVMADGETTRGYTRYGAWDGNPYEEWCASFVSFCLHYADVPEEKFPQDNNCSTWIETLKEEEFDLYIPAREEAEDGSETVYTPTAGDLVFFTWNQNDSADHIGIVSEVIPAEGEESAKIITIEGNKSDEVAYHTYTLDSAEILGYGILPEQDLVCGKKGHVHTESCSDADGNLTCEQEEHIHTAICDAEQEEQIAEEGLTELMYAGPDYTVRVTYGEDAGLPDNTELQVREIEKGSAEYETYLAQTEETLEEESAGKVRFARFFDIEFTADGVKVEPKAAVSVSITYDEEVDLSDPGNSQVIHFSENGPELLDASAKKLQDSGTRFTHTQDSFSVVGDLVTVSAEYNPTDIGPERLPVDYYVCIDGEWTCVGSTKTGWYGDYTANNWTNDNRDYITVAQAESVLGAYGFNVAAENPARNVAYQQKNIDVKLYSDTDKVTIDGQQVIPLARNAYHAGYNLYYLPSNTEVKKSISSADTLKAGNEFFTVKVYGNQQNLIHKEVVRSGSTFSYTAEEGMTENWRVSSFNGDTNIVSGNVISIDAVLSATVIEPYTGTDTPVSHSVTFKAMVDGTWTEVGSLPYYFTGEVNGQTRSYITSEMAAQFFGAFGYTSSEDPGYHFGYSYNDIYSMFYANGSTRTNFCMDVNEGKVQDAQVVQLWTSNNSNAQKFRVRDAENGYSFITPIGNSSYYVNVYGYTTGDPSSVQLKLSTATNANSQWKVDTGSDGRTTFWSAIAPTDQVIDLNNANMTNGGRLQIWHSTGGARYWYMVQQYLISNNIVTEATGNGTYKIGLTEESNGDIVCYYLPAATASGVTDQSEGSLSAQNNFWSVRVKDEKHLVYGSDMDLEQMVQYVKEGGNASVTVQDWNGVLWSCVGKNGTSPDYDVVQNIGYKTYSIRNITQPVEISATKADPAFTVQYYGYIPRYATSGDTSLKVIDTSGKVLPTNGGTMETRNLYLEKTGENTELGENAGNQVPRYRVKTVTELTKLYSNEAFNYETSPGLSYFNKLKDNTNYTLSQIWILKDGKNPSSKSSGDWNIYTYSSDMDFTNEADKANEKTILIQEGDVIRLVTNSSTGDYYNGNTFYDYNISSGQNSDGRWITKATGDNSINSKANYSNSLNGKRNWDSNADILAFGNANCGTGMSGYWFDGGPLNKYNGTVTKTLSDGTVQTVYTGRNKAYGGATFGIASSLNTDGTIRYNEWITAPKLFNDGDARGKQTYAGSSLMFSRVGDTYTLSSATLKNSNGQSNTLGNLEYFFNPSPYDGKMYTSIFTNNFWPMDQAAGRTDGLWGEYNNRGTFQGYVENNNHSWTDYPGEFPPSDDGRAHNWFFGMNFALNFNLTADYEGPLEYYFFGDDDLWVFLDNKYLICDIGGVHSSVGEYVNLRDYLPVGSSGQHTLSFFYTERGASGSTCYMSFTLPSVSASTTERDTGKLQVKKELNYTGNIDFSQYVYQFQVDLLTEENGSALNQTFSYTVSDDNPDTKDTYGTIKSGGLISLHPNETLTIGGLPAGTYYRVTEQEESRAGYETKVNNEAGYIASGKIQASEISPAEFVNTVHFELPETGGPGTDMYIIGGLLLIAAGILLIYNQKKRRKEDQNLS